ncbi:MAG TPA: glycosyltransferase family 2 protein [Candidatus Limnocylindrales bacterium]|nr:glycosyltransferase family 2 protein [Candidatus Limnocylindrales bacterium]
MRGRESGRSEPTVSVVIPAHDEAPTIESVVRSVADAVPDAEILVVDDGSSDATASIAQAAGAAVLRLPVNVGKGAAVRQGIDASTGDVVVLIDADGQDNPYEIPLLVGAFEGDVDLVLGSRFLGQFRPGAITRLNYLGTKLITWTVDVLFGQPITDPLAGFRAIRRSALERIDLRARGYDIEVDMVLRVIRAGGRVVEVPASRSARRHGSSDLSSIRDGLLILRRILSVRFERRPSTALAGATPGAAGVESDR